MSEIWFAVNNTRTESVERIKKQYADFLIALPKSYLSRVYENGELRPFDFKRDAKGVCMGFVMKEHDHKDTLNVMMLASYLFNNWRLER